MDEIIKMLDENLAYISHTLQSDTMLIAVKSMKYEICCPYCGVLSSKAHSKYLRKFRDLPIQGKKVIMTMENRKMFCLNPDCPYKTFAEHFPFLPKGAKRSIRLEQEILRVSLNCSSITSSKILSKGTVSIGKSAICRLIKKRKSESP